MAAGRVAAALARPAAQVATRIAGEIGGGAAGNVLQSGAEQAVFEGQISPRELTKAAVIGGALSLPGALALPPRPTRSGGPEALPAPPSRTITPDRAQAPLAQTQEPTARAVRPGTEEITPEFRARAQQQALELMGLSPAEIDAEIARRAPARQAEPTAQEPLAVEGFPGRAAALSAAQQRAQERTRLYEVSRNVASRSLEASRIAYDAGDYSEAQAQLDAHRRALRDQLRFAPADSPGERARLQREITRVGAAIDKVKTQSKEAAKAQSRIENQPTRGLTEPRQAPQSAILNPPSSIRHPQSAIRQVFVSARLDSQSRRRRAAGS